MPTTIREQVIQAFKTKVNAQGVLMPSDLKDRTIWPVIGIRDLDDVVTFEEYGSTHLTMSVVLEMVDEYNSTGALSRYDTNEVISIANQMIGIMVNSGLATNRNLDGLCENIKHDSSVPVYPVVGSNLIGARVIFEIDYKYDTGDPYTNSY